MRLCVLQLAATLRFPACSFGLLLCERAGYLCTKHQQVMLLKFASVDTE
jgi:hypothetical protein